MGLLRNEFIYEVVVVRVFVMMSTEYFLFFYINRECLDKFVLGYFIIIMMVIVYKRLLVVYLVSIDLIRFTLIFLNRCWMKNIFKSVVFSFFRIIFLVIFI